MYAEKMRSNKRRIGLIAMMALAMLVFGCASKNQSAQSTSDKDAMLDKLTLFVEAVQEEHFLEAMRALSPGERYKFEVIGGAKSPELQRRLKSLKLSTLAHRPTVKLGPEGLEGIFDELPNLTTSHEPAKTDTTSATPAPENLP